MVFKWLEINIFQQGCGAVAKTTQLRLWSSSLHTHGSGSISGFSSFSHIKTLIVLVCLNLNAKWIKSRTQNQENIPNLLKQFNLVVFFTSRALTMRKSAKKQQSKVQTIQRTVTSRNVSQDNDNINNSGNAVTGFGVNAWRPFVISYDQNQENSCLENYICVRAFIHRPVLIDQVFCTRCLLCLLQS